MNNIFAKEIIGDVDSFGEDAIQDEHFRLRLNRNPAHVFVLEVVQNRNLVTSEDWQIAIQVFTLEGICDDRFVLDTHQVGETGCAQSANGAFELPGRGVSGRKREMPADVVLEDG